MEFDVGNPDKAAARIAANFANGDVPREQATRRGLRDQLGVRRPARRRGGRSQESRALAEQIEQILEDQ